MGKLKQIWKNIKEYYYEHPRFKMVIEYFVTLVASFFSAFIFAYGFRAFIAPQSEEIINLISGGASGISQVLVLITGLLGIKGDVNFLQSLFYFLINVPLFFLAYKKIGKQFAFFSIINVIFVSVLISALDPSILTIFDIGEDILARALFAGVTTGLSTAIAVKFRHSAGGIDILSIYISSKKHSSMGKYTLMLNAVTVICYTILAGYQTHATAALYTIVYFFTVSMAVDALCARNKKTQLQIITNEAAIAKVLITNFPHGCTMVDAKGAYKNSDKTIIYTVVSAFEVKKVVKIAKELDPHAFITVINTTHVYGKFYIQPLK